LKKILAIDFGERRIGIAISDDHQTFSFPKLTIDTNKTPNYLGKINSIVRNNDVGKIIIGNPVRTTGEDSEKSLEIKIFAEKLREITDRNIIFWEENYTTEKAKKILHASGKSLKENKEKLDQIAASLILEDYLKNN